MAWVKHNIAERRQHLPVVLQHVRMPLLSPKFLVCFIFIPVKLHTLILVHWIWDHYLWHLLRFFDCLAHPNLSATLATAQKWPFKASWYLLLKFSRVPLTIVLIPLISSIVNGTLLNFGKRYEDNLRVIFDQWTKLHLGLDVLSNQKILNGIYCQFMYLWGEPTVGI